MNPIIGINLPGNPDPRPPEKTLPPSGTAASTQWKYPWIPFPSSSTGSSAAPGSTTSAGFSPSSRSSIRPTSAAALTSGIWAGSRSIEDVAQGFLGLSAPASRCRLSSCTTSSRGGTRRRRRSSSRPTGKPLTTRASGESFSWSRTSRSSSWTRSSNSWTAVASPKLRLAYDTGHAFLASGYFNSTPRILQEGPAVSRPPPPFGQHRHLRGPPPHGPADLRFPSHGAIGTSTAGATSTFLPISARSPTTNSSPSRRITGHVHLRVLLGPLPAVPRRSAEEGKGEGA